MLLCDDERTVVDANRVACLLLRVSPAGARGLRLDDLVAADDRPRLERAMSGRPPVDADAEPGPSDQGGPAPTTLALSMPDGGRVVVDLTCTPNVSAGVHLVTLDFPSKGVGPTTLPLLTDREREVLTQVALGRTGQAIAADLVLAPATVESHVSRALTKLGAHNRPHGVALALRSGEIDANAFAVPRGLVSAPLPDDRRGPEDLQQLGIDALDEPVTVIGRDGVVLAVNAAWRRFTAQHGLEELTAPGTNHLAMLDGAADRLGTSAEAAWGVREILEGRCETFLSEYSLPTPEGVRWIEARAARYRGEGPLRVVLRLHDVTDRRDAETDAHVARSMLDEIDAAVVLSSVDGTVTAWRVGAEALFGWTADEAHSRRLSDLVLARRDVETFRASRATVLRDGHWSGEVRMRRRDGQTFDAHVRHGLLRDAAGEPSGIVTVAVDVSVKVGAQRALLSIREQLRVVADAMEEGLVVLDAFGLVDDLNPAAERLLGWTAEDLRGKSMHEAIYEPRGSGPVLAVRRTGRTLRVEEDRFLRRDGTAIPVTYTAAPFDAGGGASGSVVVFRDVSERRREAAMMQRERAAARTLRKIRDALDEDRFVLHAQPVVELATGAPARHLLVPLIRGREGGLVAPGVYAPVAREHGLMRRIDRWVVDRAAAVAARGHRIEIAVSAESVTDPTFGSFVDATLQAEGAEPTLVTIGVSETALEVDADLAAAFVRRLSELGCGFILLEFGSSHTGISHLRDLPWGAVRVPGSFVSELRLHESSRSVVRAIVELARGFGVRSAAERVDDEPTREILLELGVQDGLGEAIGGFAPVERVLDDPGLAPPPVEADGEAGNGAPRAGANGAGGAGGAGSAGVGPREGASERGAGADADSDGSDHGDEETDGSDHGGDADGNGPGDGAHDDAPVRERSAPPGR